MNSPPFEPQLSVVIPVYNSADTLGELIRLLVASLDETGYGYEIVLVNDGSRDASWEVLCELRDSFERQLVIVDLMRNFGQHNAIMCGFRESRGEMVVTMDDDLQNPPSEIATLIKEIHEKDYDLVYGYYEEKKHNRWRNLGSELSQLFYRLIFRRKNRVTAFRIVKRQLVDSILSYSLNFTYVDGLFAWNTERIGQVLVKHKERQQGRSGYSIGKLVVLALNLFTNFSLAPLQAVSLVGFATALIGFFTGVFFVFQYLFNNILVPGYASTIVAVLILGGVQLLSLGVIGEYLGRLHLNVNRKPQYVKREVRGRAGGEIKHAG